MFRSPLISEFILDVNFNYVILVRYFMILLLHVLSDIRTYSIFPRYANTANDVKARNYTLEKYMSKVNSSFIRVCEFARDESNKIYNYGGSSDIFTPRTYGAEIESIGPVPIHRQLKVLILLFGH